MPLLMTSSRISDGIAPSAETSHPDAVRASSHIAALTEIVPTSRISSAFPVSYGPLHSSTPALFIRLPEANKRRTEVTASDDLASGVKPQNRVISRWEVSSSDEDPASRRPM